MIETQAIDQSGITIDCPYCRRALLTLHPRGPQKAFDRFVYSNERTAPVELVPRRPPLRWDIEPRLGACPTCTGDYFGINARFIDLISNDDFIHDQFFRNGERWEENNFIGRCNFCCGKTRHLRGVVIEKQNPTLMVA